MTKLAEEKLSKQSPSTLEEKREQFQNLKKNMKVVTAKYLDDYKIEIIFDDKKRNVINFLPALKKYATCKKYLDITLFKEFKVDSGNIVWGNDWEMIFKIEDLYENKFNSDTQKQTMSKQTAVEWLECELKKIPWVNVIDTFQKAKDMEREQIVDAFGIGCQVESTRLIGYQDLAQQYLNETYGDKK